MESFEFKTWCKNSDLKEATVESLQKQDLDTENARKLLQGDHSLGKAGIDSWTKASA